MGRPRVARAAHTRGVGARGGFDYAQQDREWLILVFHKLGPSTTDSIEWSPTDFAALADHVAASGIPVQTVSTVLRN